MGEPQDHPDALMSAHNLAVELRASGEYQRARDLDEDTLTAAGCWARTTSTP